MTSSPLVPVCVFIPATILYVLGLVLLRILAIAAAKKFLLKARLLNIPPVTSAGLELVENFQM